MDKFDFVTCEQITKGWSNDRKYCVSRVNGTKLLVRLVGKEHYETKKLEFEMMQQVEELGVTMCKPIEFGITEQDVYTLHSWIEGEDANELIPLLSDTEQYHYGLQAGAMLRRIHSLPAPAHQEDWEVRFNRKADSKIKLYQESSITFDGAEHLIDYINANRHLLTNRPQSFQHGDYHIGNMMVDTNKCLTIIDFNRFDFGDPWEEFNRIVWCAQQSPLFSSGIVNGYFENNVPIKFWRLLALYISSNTLGSFAWAAEFGEEELSTMLQQAEQVLEWYEHMKNPVPAWYSKGYYLQEMNGVYYKLREPFDFSFLTSYGTVFKVFDDQDSGNICFGVEKEHRKYFVKFAGAPTERYSGDPQQAIDHLKASVAVYEQLAHPSLIKLIDATEAGAGYALKFEWVDAVSMGRMYPLSHRQFTRLSVETKIRIFEEIVEFHVHVASKGYVAIDFYDGSIMYDTSKHKAMVCDIDFYAASPYINRSGRMWGSSRFMSPEEWELGARIDEVTNVYTMGATACALFSNYERSRKAWMLNDASYKVVEQALSPDRKQRQQSLPQFLAEWKVAIASEKY